MRFDRRARSLVSVAVAVSAWVCQPPLFAQHEGDRRSATLTLQEAVRLALESGAALDADAALEESEIALRSSKAAYEPKFGGSAIGNFGGVTTAGQNYGLNFSQRLRTGTTFRATVSASSQQNQLGTYFASDTSFTVTQSLASLFSPGTTNLAADRAARRVAAAQRDRSATRQRVAVEVATAYVQAAAAREVHDVAVIAADRARRLLNASRAKLAMGKVSQLDVLRADQFLAEMQLHALEARGAELDAFDRLRLLTGYDRTLMLTVGAVAAPPESGLSESEAETLALANRAELQTADEAVAEAEQAVLAASRQSVAQFDVGVAVTRQQTAPTLIESFGGGAFHPAAVVSASVPIGRADIRAVRDTARVDLARRMRGRDGLRAAVAQSARRAARQYDQLRQALALVEGNVEKAQREVDFATRRYELGLSTNLDVTSAEGNLLNARARRAEHLGRMFVAWLETRAAAGILDPLADVR